jgi:hypothetical protein
MAQPPVEATCADPMPDAAGGIGVQPDIAKTALDVTAGIVR